MQLLGRVFQNRIICVVGYHEKAAEEWQVLYDASPSSLGTGRVLPSHSLGEFFILVRLHEFHRLEETGRRALALCCLRAQSLHMPREFWPSHLNIVAHIVRVEDGMLHSVRPSQTDGTRPRGKCLLYGCLPDRSGFVWGLVSRFDRWV